MRPEYVHCFFETENRIRNSLAFKWATNKHTKKPSKRQLADSINAYFNFAYCRKDFGVSLNDYCDILWDGMDFDEGSLRKDLLKILTVSGVLEKPKIEDDPKYKELLI